MNDGTVQEPMAISGTRIFEGSLARVRDGHGWAFGAEPVRPAAEPERRPARVARLLAMAHSIEARIEAGEFRDYADVAQSLGLSQARVTQIMDLVLLAPEIQEEILFLEAVDGMEKVTERGLRKVVRIERWEEQRREWGRRREGE